MSPWWCLVSGAGNTGIYVSRSNSPDLSPVAYTICGIMRGMSATCVFKMLLNWRSFCWSFGTEWNIWLTWSNNEFCISQGSVATSLRCDGNFHTGLVGNFVFFPFIKKIINRLWFCNLPNFKTILFATQCSFVGISANRIATVIEFLKNLKDICIIFASYNKCFLLFKKNRYLFVGS